MALVSPVDRVQGFDCDATAGLTGELHVTCVPACRQISPCDVEVQIATTSQLHPDADSPLNLSNLRSDTRRVKSTES